MASEKLSPQAWTDAQACWESFVQYPTYIHPDTAVRAIATALDAARNEGRREREGEIVKFLRGEAASALNILDIADDIDAARAARRTTVAEKPILSHRDAGWSLCASCGRPRTWSGPVDPGCDCPGEGAMVVAYEEGDFTIGVDPSFGKDYTATSILDYHTLDTPTAADLLRAALRAEQAASDYRAADAIRDPAASLVPTPAIDEARPMNRAQRRAKMRRGGR